MLGGTQWNIRGRVSLVLANPQETPMPKLHRATTLAATFALVSGVALAASHSTEGDDATIDASTQEEMASDFTGFRDLSYGERSGGAVLTANMINLEGEEVGRATFSMTPTGIVVVRAEVNGLEPGEHGFHIHETGECDPATEFESAGGHYVGEGDPKHGVVEGGPHAGDMPNAVVGENGMLAVEVFNPRITLDGDTNPLIDADGSALMVHSGPDDYESQPGGDAGGRVACGVIVAGE